MSYLKQYGTKGRKFQEGGAAPMEAAPAAPAGPEGGAGGQEEQIVQLAQATVQGDQAAAAQLGTIMAPMLLQEIEAAGAQGGAPAGPEAGGQPVFKRGGKFVGIAK